MDATQTARVSLKRKRGINTILGRSKRTRKFRELGEVLFSPMETRKTVLFCRHVSFLNEIDAAHDISAIAQILYYESRLLRM